MTTTSTPSSARYDSHRRAVVIDHMAVTDHVVVAESHRWSTGLRGPSLSASEMDGADLSGFVTQALAVGAHAIASAGGVQETFNLQSLVTEVGDRTADAAAKAATATAETTIKAASEMEMATTAAKKAIADAGNDARKNFSNNVDDAKKALSEEIQRLIGGDNPELQTDRVEPVSRGGRAEPERAGVAWPGATR